MSLDLQDLLTWADELHQVKGNVSQLQATLNQILNKAPTIDQFQQLSLSLDKTFSHKHGQATVERIRSLLLSPQIKVAVRLKRLFDQGLLPGLLALSRINFKSPKSDRFVGYFLDYTPPPDIRQSLPEQLTKSLPEQEDVSSYPPSLPTISHDSILKRVFTHKSLRQPSDFLELASLQDFAQLHNGKLAAKGRSLLEYFLMEIIDNAIPTIDEENVLSSCRHMMSRSILAKFALGYNMVQAIQFNFSDSVSIDNKLQIFGNVFLAYLAGMKLDGFSYEEIKLWLKKLYQPLLTDLLQNSHHNVSALSELQFLFKRVTDIYAAKSKEVRLEFTQLESDPFAVQLLVNGQHLAVGTSSKSDAEARERAAEQVFADKTELDRILSELLDLFQPEVEDIEDPYSPRLEEEVKANESEQVEEKEAVEQKEEKEEKEEKEVRESREDSKEVERKLPSSLPSIPNRTPAHPASHAMNAPKVPHAAHAAHQYNSPQPYGAPLLRGPAPYTLTSFAEPDQFSAKNQLNALLAPLTPAYNFQKISDGYQVQVSVDEIILATATDLTKKVATLRAAASALNNIEALEKLGVKNSKH